MITRNEFSAQLREQLEQSDAYPAWEEEAVWEKIVATPVAPRKGGRFWILLLSLPFLALMNADCGLKVPEAELPSPQNAAQAPVATLNQASKKDLDVLKPAKNVRRKQSVPTNRTNIETPMPDVPPSDSQLIAVLIDRNTCIQVETEWLVWNDLKDQYQFLDLFRPTQDSTLSLPPEIKLKTF